LAQARVLELIEVVSLASLDAAILGMVSRLLCRALCSIVAIAPHATGTCLPDAVPVTDQVQVRIDGVTGPLRVWSPGAPLLSDTAVKKAFAESFKIVAEELLGYQVAFSGSCGTCSSSEEGYSILAGCNEGSHCSPTNESVSDVHVAFDIREQSTGELESRFQAPLGLRLPTFVGSTGVTPFSGYHVRTDTRIRGLSEDQLRLDLYADYNARDRTHEKFFTPFAQLELSKFQTCADTPNMMSHTLMKPYADNFPDDEGGYEQYMQSGQRFRAKCYYPSADDGSRNGYFWLSPMCREDITTCVFFVTGPTGEGAERMMHKANTYRMAVALAFARDLDDVASLYNVVAYVSSPGILPGGHKMNPIVFPPHDAEEYSKQNFATASTQLVSHKYVHHQLRDAAPLAYKTASMMQLQNSGVQHILTDVAMGLSYSDAACAYLKKQFTKKSWLKQGMALVCSRGEGLVSSAGDHVEVIAQASRCEWCPLAHYSLEIYDEAAGEATRVCRKCPLVLDALVATAQRQCRSSPSSLPASGNDDSDDNTALIIVLTLVGVVAVMLCCCLGVLIVREKKGKPVFGQPFVEHRDDSPTTIGREPAEL